MNVREHISSSCDVKWLSKNIFCVPVLRTDLRLIVITMVVFCFALQLTLFMFNVLILYWPWPFSPQSNDEARQQSREYEETKKQIEEDADREILDIKNKYERRLRDEKEANMRLKGETGIMKKKVSLQWTQASSLLSFFIFFSIQRLLYWDWI